MVFLSLPDVNISRRSLIMPRRGDKKEEPGRGKEIKDQLKISPPSLLDPALHRFLLFFTIGKDINI